MAEEEEKPFTLEDFENLHTIKGSRLDILAAVASHARKILLRRQEKQPMPESSAARAEKFLPRRQEKRALPESFDARAEKFLRRRQEKRPLLESAATSNSDDQPPPKKRMHDGEASSSSTTKKRRSSVRIQIHQHPSPPQNEQPQPQNQQPQPEPPLALPEEFEMAIRDLAGGRNVGPRRLVIQKALTKTDVAKNNNRLSIPFSQIKDDFLTEKEKGILRNKEHFMVTIIVPSLETETVKFNRWDMPKDNGSKTSSTYVLNGKWNDIVLKNRLKEGKIVQLWSFRIEHNLCLALRLLPHA